MLQLLLFLHLVAVTYWIGALGFAGFVWIPRSRGKPTTAPQDWTDRAQIVQSLATIGLVAGTLLLATGVALVIWMGGLATLDVARWAMVLLGTVVALGAFHLYFSSRKGLQRALRAQDWSAAEQAFQKFGRFARMFALLALLAILAGVWGA
ncbi:hypothetical protein A5904_10880 [Acidithiobacillus caldus]|jgi:uncharacterized membrane protein|uniref:Copper resistance protein D domain-containing protein n=2 Tax=Acidithiobacillus caldus TaxID=33059 RepID=F9ZRD5_ACICS|nr:hypothetical protein [Acidithiobacillus caldus]AEK58933.1 conserved hypothetical protein [Acidithiobacillus caldus SM-1]AUW33338.1 hypothetical protein A5904_10880 [Acidithiobacillus caldus]MBU2782197.1 hypothetical protein [Acidithiobacillus caldus]MBU2802459.1 hypothetical protein [Acidithiobacillus caldus]OFC30435.1 hypothetical protein BAE28_14010 [Acidithiobacillus caldus]